MYAATYSSHLEETRNHNEASDCAVRAVSAATGTAYSIVHSVMSKLGRPARKGTPVPIINAAIEGFGFAHERVEVTNVTTVKALEKLLAKHPGHSPVMVYVRRHVLTIIDGKAIDWASNRQHKIERIEVIVPHGEYRNVPSFTDKPKKAFNVTKRPGPNSKCGKLWAFLDDADNGVGGAHSAEFFEWSTEYFQFYRSLGVARPTAKAQHFRWRKANGHVGRKSNW